MAAPFPVRCIYQASNGQGYCVIAQRVFYIHPDWTLEQIGTLQANRSNPCSMSDNGITILLVDGSTQGYTIDLATNAFAVFFDPNDAFQGADKVDYIDTYTLWNLPGTKLFGSTLSNTLDIDPTWIAAKTVYPDPLQTLVVIRREILLLGAFKSEVWYDAGNPLFPFALLPGSHIEHGTCAKYSVANADIATYFLGQDKQGQGVVFRVKAYDCKRISNHAIEYAIRLMAERGPISDAIGYTYQQDGHVFYVLTFPSGDQTWVFDEATQEWHQRGWTDADGVLHRDRSNCFAYLYGKKVVGDWENGTIYELDPKYYVDRVDDVDYPISFVRSFPHIATAEIDAPDGSGKTTVITDGRRVEFKSFTLDLECGNSPLDANGNPASVILRWSDDKGKTWGTAVLQTSGRPGEWLTQPKWAGLGIARDRVFEVAYSIAGEAALNGAWVDAMVLKS